MCAVAIVILIAAITRNVSRSHDNSFDYQVKQAKAAYSAGNINSAVLDVPSAFAQIGKLGAGIGKMLVSGGAALVQLGLSLDALLATLGHAIDVALFNPKEHIRLALGRIQACRRVDRQLLSARLLTLLANLLDIALDLIDLCRVGI